ncbi:telomere repeats-binding bouquet formation protein 2 [Echeneis naucrates]|uniref:telomere repeats-binding bouquet formation protein 2 n=1 Tax=Echeneis naucrates TaxID=173247 RepID=UPI0011134B7E|nr:telomere repeats-binding bouquet formation protein 2 [Echeneis naucrates]
MFPVVLQGGIIADWRTSDYLFSGDAACPDTVRIFESQDYLWNNVTVFQSLFLSTCEKRQSVKSVAIGHYVLPPVSVQDEVRKVVGRLIWECEDEQLVEHASCKSFSFQAETEKSEGKVTRGFVSMDSLQKYTGELHDFHPVYFHCSNCEAHPATNMHSGRKLFKRKK